jgi:hypothetical protein
MNAPGTIEAEPLALLRQPFPPHQISKLPKPFKKDAPKGNCKECGGYHGLPAVHLDYVGHAALTDRLLDTDPHWNWEPMGLNPDGTPALDRNGGLWIKLTVCGVTRPGYGCADGKSGGNAIKELIGDALRNAAMRFGAALDLWHKGELHADEDGDAGDEAGKGAVGSGVPKTEHTFPPGPATGITQLKNLVRPLWREIAGCGDDDELDPLLAVPDNKALIEQCMALTDPNHRQIWEGDGKDNPGLNGLIQNMRAEFAQRAPNILQAG